MTALLVDGMHGLGDNLHQRALLRHWLGAGYDVWLRTPWPCLYQDLDPARLRLLGVPRTLRTQTKNATREAARYTRETPPRDAHPLRISYDPATTRAAGSILAGMIRRTLGGDHIEAPDITLPVPPQWRSRADAIVGRPAKPVMVLRPLVDRREWGGCSARNPDHVAYAALYASIRDRFFVVSVADLVPSVEWLVGPLLPADLSFHAGEMDTEVLVGLIAGAALTFCSPGFALPMALAVGTPAVCVFGGYESARLWQHGPRFAPMLGINPISPCECFAHTHRCDKRIDLPEARDHLESFIGAHCNAAAHRHQVVA